MIDKCRCLAFLEGLDYPKTLSVTYINKPRALSRWKSYGYTHHSSSDRPFVGPPRYIAWQHTIIRWLHCACGRCILYVLFLDLVLNTENVLSLRLKPPGCVGTLPKPFSCYSRDDKNHKVCLTWLSTNLLLEYNLITYALQAPEV